MKINTFVKSIMALGVLVSTSLLSYTASANDTALQTCHDCTSPVTVAAAIDKYKSLSIKPTYVIVYDAINRIVTKTYCYEKEFSDPFEPGGGFTTYLPVCEITPLSSSELNGQYDINNAIDYYFDTLKQQNFVGPFVHESNGLLVSERNFSEDYADSAFDMLMSSANMNRMFDTYITSISGYIYSHLEGFANAFDFLAPGLKDLNLAIKINFIDGTSLLLIPDLNSETFIVVSGKIGDSALPLNTEQFQDNFEFPTYASLLAFIDWMDFNGVQQVDPLIPPSSSSLYEPPSPNTGMKCYKISNGHIHCQIEQK